MSYSVSKKHLQNKRTDFSEASKLFSACAVNLERDNSFFWAAVSRENEGKSWISGSKQQSKPELINETKGAFLKAAHNYGLEAEIYEKNHCYLLAERAKADKSWCESQVK